MKTENVLTSQIMKNPEILFHDNYSLKDNDFIVSENKMIINTIKLCLSDGLDVNIITLMKKNKELSAKTLSDYNGVPTDANWQFYHDRLLEKSKIRKLGYLASLINDGIKSKHESNKLMQQVDEILGDIGNSCQKSKILGIKELMHNYINDVEDKYKRVQAGEDCLCGIRTGFEQLDSLMLGLQKDHFIIIGARPSAGKTACLINMASHIAFKEKKNVGFITTESSSNQITSRLVAGEARIDPKAMRTGYVNKSSMGSIINLADKIHDKAFYVYDSPNAKLSEVKYIGKRMKELYDIDVLFVDYIQNIQNDNTRIPKHEQIEQISRELKHLNRQLEIPVVTAAQISRDSQNREPHLADLRGSGQIEQDADDVIFIHHEEEEEQERSYLIVSKGRDTGTGKIEVDFIKKYVKFQDK